MSRPSNHICVQVLVALSLLPCPGVAGTREQDLLLAIRSGDLTRAGELPASRAELNRPLPDGSSLLAWAVEGQDAAMVRLLLDRKANPDGAGGTSTVPLLIACRYGDPGIIGLLLDAGAKVKVAQPDGITPLALCAGTAPAAVVQRLIAAGAAVDSSDVRGQTPLMRAAAMGRVDNIQLLVERGAAINRETSQGFTPLFFALKSKVPEAPMAVIEAGGSANHVSRDGTTAVQLAMYQKDYGFAAGMITRGADLAAFDLNGNQLLHAAVLAGQPSLVSQLLAARADPNALTGTSQVKWRYEANFKTSEYEPPRIPPLMIAAARGFGDIMKLLAAAGADPGWRNAEGENIVFAAAGSGSASTLATALQLAPDPDVTDGSGQTVLHRLLSSDPGAETGAMLRLLASKGARTTLKDDKGRTAAELGQGAQAEMKAMYQASFGVGGKAL